MSREVRFRMLLPVAQTVLAALFGGVGLWQRNQILRQPFWGDQPLWESSARFHVWPWPYKFAVVSNMPAVLAGLLLSWPIGAAWPDLPESVQIAPSLLFVPILWYWAGSRLDRRWGVKDKTPWIALSIFTFVCLVGAFIPIGYIGYLPYGAAVWSVTAIAIIPLTHPASKR